MRDWDFYYTSSVQGTQISDKVFEDSEILKEIFDRFYRNGKEMSK